MYNSVTDEAMALDAFDFESNLFGDFDTDQTNTSMAQSHTNAAPGTLPDTSGVQGESLLGPDTQLDSGLVGMDWSHISAADPSLLSIMSSTGGTYRNTLYHRLDTYMSQKPADPNTKSAARALPSMDDVIVHHTQ